MSFRTCSWLLPQKEQRYGTFGPFDVPLVVTEIESSLLRLLVVQLDGFLFRRGVGDGAPLTPAQAEVMCPGDQRIPGGGVDVIDDAIVLRRLGRHEKVPLRVLAHLVQRLLRVVDGEAARDDATGRVDVEADVLLRILGVEEQELCDDQVRDVVLDLVAEEDDTLPQQSRVDVVGALATAAGFDDHRYEHLGLPGCGGSSRCDGSSRADWMRLLDGQPARAGAGLSACSMTVPGSVASIAATDRAWSSSTPSAGPSSM